MVSPSPKVEEYSPKEGDSFAPYLFIVIHAVDYSRRECHFATSELNFFLGKNFLVTYHDVPLKSVSQTEERAAKATMHIARAPDRVAHTLLDALVDNYKPALEELIRQAAQGEVLHNDDTSMRVLRLAREPSDKRTGVFTSGIVAISEARKIALYFTGPQHAGENLAAILRRRLAE